MTAKTSAALAAELADNFRLAFPYNEQFIVRLSTFLTNLVDSVAGGTANGYLLISGAGVPVDYTDGSPPATGEGTSPPGGLYIDTTGGLVYRNDGTLAEPIWVDLADAA